MEHKTADDLAYQCYKENQPIDRYWLKKLKRERTDKEMLEWAKGNIELFADENCTKNKITSAAKILLKYLHL